MTKESEIVFDATDAIVGRLCAKAMKEALNGKTVTILNAEKAVISGSAVNLKALFMARRGVQQKSNPEHSPVWPRRPDLLFKKIISGMAPKKKQSGAMALKRVKIYLGVPKEFAGKTAEKYGVKLSFPRAGRTTLKELCILLGWTATV